MARREIDVYINVPEARQQVGDSDSGAVNNRLQLFRQEQVLFKFHLRGAASAAYAVAAGTTFLLGVDNVFTPSHADLVLSPDSEFNVSGDWADVDLATGKISARANFNTAELATALGSQTSSTMYLVLWGLDGVTGDPFVLAHIQVDVRNVAVEAAPPGSPPSPGDVWVTFAQLYKFQVGAATNAGADTAVTFPVPFAAVPAVVATIGAGATELAHVEITAVTVNGFTFTVRGGAGVVADAWTIQWQAATVASWFNRKIAADDATKPGASATVDVDLTADNFAAAPVIICGPKGAQTEVLSFTITAISATSFTVKVWDAAGVHMNAVDFYWVAVGT